MDADGGGGSGGLSPRAQQLKEELLGEFSLTVDDVAGILEVDRSTIYRYIQDGGLAALKIGREYRLSEVDVKGFLQALIERERRRVAELRVKAMPVPPSPSPEAPLQPTEPGPGGSGEFGEMLQAIHNQAVAEARRTGHAAVHPAHVLLALASDQDYIRWGGPFPEQGSLRDGLARQVLQRVGADIPTLRSAAEALLPPPDETPGGGDANRDVLPEARAALFRRPGEVRAALDRRWVGTDCLLLALYSFPQLAEVLRSAGAPEEAVRTELRAASAVLATQGSEGVRFGELARHVTRAAGNIAWRRGAADITPEDLLLALSEEEPAVRDGLARRVLDELQADVGAIRAAAKARLGPDRAPRQASAPAGAAPLELLEPTLGLRTVVFERAAAAAKGLGHDQVGTEHLLLGLYSIPEIAEVLEQGGAPHSAVRVAIRQLAPAGAPQPTERRPMYGRYSERAQKIVVQAQLESRRRGTGYVACEHILLAVLSDEDAAKQGIARKALDNLGVDVRALRPKVEALLPEPQHPGGGPKGDIQFTPSAKALVMDHALAYASAMGHAYIGTEHLLLAAYDASPALQGLLEESGAVREGVEAETLRLLGGSVGQPELPLHDGARALARVAVAEARRLGHAALQPGHFLLALTAEDPEVRGGTARVILDRLRVDVQALRRAAEAALPKARRPRPDGPVQPNHDAQTLVSTHAVAAARSQGAARIGSQHLLLGLYATPDIAQSLTAAGAAEDAVRVEAGRLEGER